MQSPANNSEVDFQSLRQQLRKGLISIDDFLDALGIEKWLGVYANRYDFQRFGGTYDREDLEIDSILRVRNLAPRLDPEQIPDERAFLGWIMVVVYHAYDDALRKYKKHFRNDKWTRTDEPIVDINIPAPDEDFDRKYYLSRFLEFIRNSPPERRRAILLWLEGHSYRDIEKTLRDEGIKHSYHTVQRWVTKSLNAFRENLRLPPFEEAQLELTGGARLRVALMTRDKSDARMTPAQILAEIAALPLEGAGGEFSGRDHDEVLYPRK